MLILAYKSQLQHFSCPHGCLPETQEFHLRARARLADRILLGTSMVIEPTDRHRSRARQRTLLMIRRLCSKQQKNAKNTWKTQQTAPNPVQG